jgi:hypothetical protein
MHQKLMTIEVGMEYEPESLSDSPPQLVAFLSNTVGLARTAMRDSLPPQLTEMTRYDRFGRKT